MKVLQTVCVYGPTKFPVTIPVDKILSVARGTNGAANIALGEHTVESVEQYEVILMRAFDLGPLEIDGWKGDVDEL
jgi:hypothetical protein